ncbi:MAG: tetratricopeptide repeat protein [FCB group bacterium]|nr:tetratricopeptide repeat protein [FCB group bacterium]
MKKGRHKFLDLEAYDTDKMANTYLAQYDKLFTELINEPVTLLELGVDQGGSIQLWGDYFPKGTIVGVDVRIPDIVFPERVHAIQCDQADKKKLTEIADTFAADGFDIIIDDASHIGKLAKISFWHLFHNHLKTGGYYIIEDWGTGYWDDWVDGKSTDLENYDDRDDDIFPYNFPVRKLKTPMNNHSHGMVGFIKQLIDEMGAGDVTKKLLSNPSVRPSKFESIAIFPGLFVIKKAQFDYFHWEKRLEEASEYLKKEHIENSLHIYQNLILKREDERVYRGLAACYSFQGKYMAALENLKEGIALNPNSPYSYNLLGEVLNKMGNYDEANKYFLLARSFIENNE